MAPGKAVVRHPVLHRDATVARASSHRPQVIGKTKRKFCTAYTGATSFGTAAIVLLDGQRAVQGGQLHGKVRTQTCKKLGFANGTVFVAARFLSSTGIPPLSHTRTSLSPLKKRGAEAKRTSPMSRHIRHHQRSRREEQHKSNAATPQLRFTHSPTWRPKERKSTDKG